MAWTIDWDGDSYREASEDRCGVWNAPFGHVLIVADGMGGRSGGAIAAEFIRENAERLSTLAKQPTPLELRDWLIQVDKAASRIAGMGESTALVCTLTEYAMAFAAVGDSASWWIGETKVVRIGEHSQAKPWIGSGGARPFAYAAPVESGILMLMTDGVWKYADGNHLVERARTKDVKHVIDAARMRSGVLQDDAAAIIARYTSNNAV